MVKRIKKRIPKASEAEVEPGIEGGGDAEIEFEAAPASIGEQIEAMAEDDFTEKTAGLFKWIIDNGKILATVGVVAVVGAIGVTLYQRTDLGKDAEATAAFFSAYEAQSKATPLGAEAPAADARKTQLEKARQLYQSVQVSYADRQVAQLAGLGLAGIQANLGDQDAALKALDSFLAQATSLDPLARAVALQAKATVQENRADFAGASATWKILQELDRETYALLAGLEIGRLHERQAQPAEARKLYEQLLKDHTEQLEGMAGRAFKAELDKRLARLGA